jgi:prepilin-type N-terminal cleavage/methylation domain-containing protein
VKKGFTVAKAFTLVELLVAIAIIAILAALLFPVLSHAEASGHRTACLNNLKQIAAGVHMYAGDFNEILFPIINTTNSPPDPVALYEWTAYDPLMRSYAGLNSAPSPRDKLFVCPADTYRLGSQNGHTVIVPQGVHLESDFNFSSYIFNAGNAAFRDPRPIPGMFPGIMGSRLGSIKNPARTVLVGEHPAWDGYSWHHPRFSGKKRYNNAPDMLSFADGHVSFIKMYSGPNAYSPTHGIPFYFDPPAGYDYQWSGN